MSPVSMLLANFMADRNLHAYIQTGSNGRDVKVRLEQGQITLRDGRVQEYRLSPGEQQRLGLSWQADLEGKLQGKNIDLKA